MYGCITDYGGFLHCVWTVQAGVGWDGTEGGSGGRDLDTKDAAGNGNPHFCTAEQK